MCIVFEEGICCKWYCSPSHEVVEHDHAYAQHRKEERHVHGVPFRLVHIPHRVAEQTPSLKLLNLGCLRNLSCCSSYCHFASYAHFCKDLEVLRGEQSLIDYCSEARGVSLLYPKQGHAWIVLDLLIPSHQLNQRLLDPEDFSVRYFSLGALSPSPSKITTLFDFDYGDLFTLDILLAVQCKGVVKLIFLTVRMDCQLHKVRRQTKQLAIYIYIVFLPKKAISVLIYFKSLHLTKMSLLHHVDNLFLRTVDLKRLIFVLFHQHQLCSAWRGCARPFIKVMSLVKIVQSLVHM